MRTPTPADQALWQGVLKHVPLDLVLLPYLSRPAAAAAASSDSASASSAATYVEAAAGSEAGAAGATATQIEAAVGSEWGVGTQSGARQGEAQGQDQGYLELVEMDELPHLAPAQGGAGEPGGRKGYEGWKMRFKGRVLPEWGNGSGNMHGAATAFLVDTCTSAALISLHTDSFWNAPMLGGVSLALDVQYYHPAPVGTNLIIDVEVNRLSYTLANLTCHIRDTNGKVLALGTHIKAWRPLRNKGKL